MILAINHLTYERNEQRLINDISCELHAGHVLQIRGANGSGKSTLLRILAGFIEPQKGNIYWQGNDIHHQREAYQHQLHYIGHQNGLKPTLTVLENLQLTSVLSQTEKTYFRKAIFKLGIQKICDKPANQLSAGQQRRIALARLLINPASLWILDEPTASLDAEGQILFQDILHEHSEKGGIAIIAVHQALELNKQPETIYLSGEQHV